jgi:hypothetical protein
MDSSSSFSSAAFQTADFPIDPTSTAPAGVQIIAGLARGTAYFARVAVGNVLGYSGFTLSNPDSAAPAGVTTMWADVAQGLGGYQNCHQVGITTQYMCARVACVARAMH